MLAQNDVCTIIKKTENTAPSFTSNQPSFPECDPDIVSYTCDVQPYNGAMAYRNYGVSDDSIRWRTFGPANTNLADGDHLLFTSGKYDGRTFEIRYVRDWENHYECSLKEVV